MDIEAAFFDYSNTLARGNFDMSRQTKQALSRMKKEGIIIGVVSGLPSSFIWAKGIEVGFDLYGGESGADAFSPKYGFSFKHQAQIKGLGGLVRWVEKRYGGQVWWQPNRFVKTIKPRDGTSKLRLHEMYCDVESYVTGRRMEVRPYLEEDAIDLIPTGVSKFKLIDAFLCHLQKTHGRIPRERVAAVGDGLNDLEMVERSGFPAAPSNACVEIRELVKKREGLISEEPYGAVVLELEKMLKGV